MIERFHCFFGNAKTFCQLGIVDGTVAV